MAVTADAQGTNARSGGGVTSFNYTGMIVGVGVSNGALVITLTFNSRSVTGVAVTWGGVSMTQIQSVTTAGTAGLAQLWGITQTAGGGTFTGNQTAAISWTGGAQVSACGASWNGVDQTGGVTSFPNSSTNTGLSATSTITTTSATGNEVMAVHTAGDTSVTINSVNNTQLYRDNTAATGSGSNYASGAASVAMTATFSGATQFGVASTDIKAAAAGPSGGLRLNSSLDGLGASGSFFRDPLGY